ncbi:MAG: alanine--glyoxylate aminotransferase family protein [Pseudomonadota bacterium]|nr:MAG: alanine--glyoxylate aminotransferase family protein [Pseudomonadota bacterium]
MQFKSFNPPVRTLMGPGPVDVHPRVLAAMNRPTIGHLDPAFVGMMDEIKVMLQYAFQTQNAFTIPISAPGSAGMETCIVNLVEPGDKVIVCVNGVFGLRMKEVVERVRGVPVTVEFPWGEPVDPQVLEDTLKANRDARFVAFVHAETSTGVESDACAVSEVARRYDCLTIVDAVTSLGGSPLRVDEWRLDAVFSGSQKCLSSTPGLSPITISERAVQRIRDRKSSVPSWFLDLNLVMAYWGSGQRAYHHTAPVNPLYALHESLVLLSNEGLENAWARHRKHHLALRAGLEAMGLRFYVQEHVRLPQLNAIVVPHGINESELRRRLLEEYSLEIGAGLGALAGKIVRIGLMGYGSNVKNVLYCLAALEEVLSEMRLPIDKGIAERAVHAALG